MRPSDLSRLHVLGDPRVHPDGRRVVFVVSTPDLDDDTYVRAIHLWDPDAGDRQLTHGPKDTAPRWSPDGRRLAFLRTGGGEDDHPQLAVMPADGGEAVVLTDLSLGVSDLAWSPDSRRLAVVGVEWTPDLADLDDDERARRPRRITRLPYREDTDGWLHDRRSHLWLIDADGRADPRCLTPGDDDESAPAFRPSGRTIVFSSRRGADRETNPGAALYEIGVDGGAPTLLVDPGLWNHPLCLDADRLVVSGLHDPFAWPSPPRLYVHHRHTGLTDLSVGLDRDVTFDLPAPVVTASGHLALVHDRGRSNVYRFAEERAPELVIGGDRTVTGVSASPDGTTVAFTATTAADPGELWLATDEAEQVCTAINADLRNDGDLVHATHLTFTRDSHEIDAWVLLPPDPGEDVPLLLNIHGGPTSQYGFGFLDEFQVYAAAGYAVVATNPRGSSGRGRAWARAVVGTWVDAASPDTLDLEAAVDMVLARYPQISRARLGVMGGSYGGYATARLLTRSDRFRSAIVERGLLNWVSFGGTSDIGPYFDRMFMDRSLPVDAAALWSASPVGLADRITTPTLVIHAEHDWRCPIEQGEQLFAMLRRHGVRAELLRFPDENHELSRSGAPKHRVERFEAILDWHDRHLGQTDEATPERTQRAMSATTAPVTRIRSAGASSMSKPRRPPDT
jgi:dipeptidyl aminopeptidase/acylaminoacyl peptidase